VGSRAQPGLDHHRRRVHPYLTSARAGDQSPQPFRLPHSKIVVLWLRSRRRLGRLPQPFHQAHRVPPAGRLTARTAVGCRPTGTTLCPGSLSPRRHIREDIRAASRRPKDPRREIDKARLCTTLRQQPARSPGKPRTWSRRPGIPALNRFVVDSSCPGLLRRVGREPTSAAQPGPLLPRRRRIPQSGGQVAD
jgi:hypothetical protein